MASIKIQNLPVKTPLDTMKIPTGGFGDYAITIGQIAEHFKLNNGFTTKDQLDLHINDKENPHNVTKAQIGLSNVDNTSDANKPLSNEQKSYVDNSVITLQNQINENKEHPNLIGRELANAHPASAIQDVSGFSQQDVNNVLTSGYAYIEFFGDTITDATNAINMCLLYCKQYGKTAKSIPNKEYPCTSTIIIQSSCDFSESIFVFPKTFNNVSVDIRRIDNDSVTLARDLKIKLPKILNNKDLGAIPFANSIGVRVTALRDSEIFFDSIQGFEQNLQLYSNDLNLYTAYNSFYFTGLLVGSKINIHMLCEASGWINECSWFGGHFAEYSQDHAAYNAINLKISKPDTGGNNAPNGHTFVRCSMEGNFSQTIDYDFNPSIATSYYSCNTFVNCRFEAAVSMRFSPYALYDLFINCLGLGGVTFANDVRPNATGSPRYSNMAMDVAAVPGATGFRNSKATHLFQTGNSSGAIALATGFQNRVNGGLLASGGYVLFNPSNDTSLHPILKLSLDAGSPALSMGDGLSAPTEKMFRYAPNDWRHTFNLRPSSDLSVNIGSSGLRYKEVHVQDLAIYPPTSNNPTVNGEMTFEATSDTQVKIKLKGSDGVVRSATITLS